jgi:hypothetical protein
LFGDLLVGTAMLIFPGISRSKRKRCDREDSPRDDRAAQDLANNVGDEKSRDFAIFQISKPFATVYII